MVGTDFGYKNNIRDNRNVAPRGAVIHEPFTLLSYAAGLTGVRLAPYLAATAVGLLPSTVVQVGLGASAPFVVAHATAFAAVPVVVVAALAGAGLLVWRRRRRAADAQLHPAG